MSMQHKSIKARAAECINARAEGAMRRLPGSMVLAVALLHPGAVLAGKLSLNSGTRQVTLLEMYTSQGCSSCPPAERWLNEYVGDDDLWTRIVPIVFHVDYWDYIGWKDPYASVAYGERQRDYARNGKTRTVYTPGLFNNGREWRGWTLRMDPRASSREPGNLSATIEDGHVSAAFEAMQGKPGELHVALLGFDIETKVERGENRNSTLAQEFVVLAHEAGLSSDGHWELPMPAATAAAGRYGVAVWVSEPGKPTPLQATGGWLEPESGG